jgi:fumarate reductase subunit C
MSQTPAYTEYHPRWYRTRVSTYWWSKRWAYFAFILRELSSLFIAWFVAFTLLQIRAVSQGKEQYDAFLEWCRHPAVLTINIITLFFVVFHALTWFSLAPKAMVVRLRGKRVPGSWIAGSNYAAWVVLSALLAWIILRRG